MKVLHLLKSDKFSGAENVVLTIMDLFPEIEMIYASPDGPIREVIEQRQKKFYPLESCSLGSIKKSIQQLQPDIIHAHDFTMSMEAAWATNKIPIVAHLHNNPPWLSKIHPKSILFALALPRINQVVTVSKSVQEEYLFGCLMCEKNTVLGNVVDVDCVKQLAEQPVQCEMADLVFLGRLTEPKNPVLFCEIVKETKERYPYIKARMIGDGDMNESIKEYIQKNNLQENIELVGFQKNPYPYLKWSRIMVMPSLWEGFGLAAVEGMALGNPVICSGVGGLKDIVDSTCGKICKTIDEYVIEIDSLLKDSEIYEEKKSNALKKAELFSNTQSYKQKVSKIYKELNGAK